MTNPNVEIPYTDKFYTQDCAEAAHHWFDFGLTVIPICTSTKKTAVKWDSWVESLSHWCITDHWEKNPTHELGAIVNSDFFVLDADSQEAQSALFGLESIFDVVPTLIVKTSKGVHHFFRKGQNTYAIAKGYSSKSEPHKIDIRTGRTKLEGRSMIILSPSRGKEILQIESDTVDGLTDVDQDFIDAVFQHNGEEPPRVRKPKQRSENHFVNTSSEVAEILGHISPDVSYSDWLAVLMGLHEKYNGSNDGLAIAARWSSGGTDYPGYSVIEDKWNSFTTAGGTTFAIVAKMAEDKGANLSEIAKRHQEWSEPLLFGEIETPTISVSLLPGWLGTMADNVSKMTQTPPAMAAVMGLAVVATCTAKRFEVSPHGEGYSEPLNLWTATAMPPASIKTAVKNAMVAPLEEWEREQALDMAEEIRDSKMKRNHASKRIEVLTKKAANEDDAVKRRLLEEEAAQVERDMPPAIIAPRLWTGDTTAETLQGLLVDHDERMAVLSDEGGIFEVMAGLYSDGRANLDVFLQGHAGGSVRVDRQSRTAHLDSPAVSFGLAIQPSILADMANGGKRKFRGNGCLARFLYTVPKSNIGSRDVRAVHQIPATVSAQYRAGIFDLLSIEPQKAITGHDDGPEVPRMLTLTHDARESWFAFWDMLESRQGEGGDLESISDWSGKLHGAALRVAGNFHLVEHGKNAPLQIGVETMELALDFSELLIDHAKAAFGLMDSDTSTGDSQKIFAWIVSEKLDQFKRGEVYRHFKGRFTGKTDRLDKALKDLETRAIVTPGTQKTSGRAATLYDVNPLVVVA